jgi:hypothetical protein
VLCAGITAAGGSCVDAAAWSVVAKIGSSKRMARVSAVSANCRDIDVAVVAGRGAQRRRRCVAAVSEFAVVSCRGFRTTGIDLRNLIGLGGLLRLTLAASQGGNFTRDIPRD